MINTASYTPKQKLETDFGGVAIIFWGDILQLRPVRARYICKEPINESFALSHLIDSLWQKKNNHRQGEDRKHANVLNSISKGDVSEEAVAMLKTRVKPINHPEISKDALTVTCVNREVNCINSEKPLELPGKEFILEAINKSQTKNHEFLD